MTDMELFKTGSQPGKGRYICAACKNDVNLDDDTDRLPPCAKCKKTEFFVSEWQEEPQMKTKEQKPAKDQIKVMAEEGGRFSSNRNGTHIEAILDEGENIITKAQFELCKNAHGIKRL